MARRARGPHSGPADERRCARGREAAPHPYPRRVARRRAHPDPDPAAADDAPDHLALEETEAARLREAITLDEAGLAAMVEEGRTRLRGRTTSGRGTWSASEVTGGT